MDYEKKYKNALTIARSRFKIEKDESVLTCLGMMFPELLESEDEMTRKKAIAILKQQRDYWSYDGPIDKFPPATPRKDLVDAIDVALSYLEKQKEQKPAWSEVELLFRGEKVTVKRPFYRDDKSRGYSTAELDEDVAWNALRAWCEKKGVSLYDLYPKAEWSEEDEKNSAFIVAALDAYNRLRKGNNNSAGQEEFDRAVNWIHHRFKSLRPQPKQEWSKADENKIERLAFLVSVAAEKEMISEEECIDLRRFVKSYRPSWKPSEEQMMALEVAFRKDGDDKYRSTINSLYNDLKKL